MDTFTYKVQAEKSDIEVACFESCDGSIVVTALIITSGDTRTQIHMNTSVMRKLASYLVNAAQTRDKEEVARSIEANRKRASCSQ